MLSASRQMEILFVLAIGLVVDFHVWFADGATDFKCPELDGQFEDTRQCDKYYECIDGRAYEKLCPDGLVFDPTIRKINKCDQPFNVDCGDRQELQPQKSNNLCPRRNGFFAHPDESVCDIFYNCIEGEAIEVRCTQGLHFDEYSGTCVWPDTLGRKGCRQEEVALSDGFQCPKESTKDVHGMTEAHPKYPHPTDCQKFYVCLNGKEPRELGCQVSEVYNEVSQRCDAPENVPGCEDWYNESDQPPQKLPGAQQQQQQQQQQQYRAGLSANKQQ